jgi:predicted cupin superfamily sugar epimerase
MNLEARKIMESLQLAPLPHEGGFFRQTWRSETGSAILFLLTEDDFSALHRLRTDEIWHFYAGDAVEHVQLDYRSATLRATRVGPAILGGDVAQLTVPGGVWQGARLASGTLATTTPRGWALLGCTMTPPWDEREFELGVRTDLLRHFPAHAPIVCALTR